jgi:hypothetical protein
MIRCRRTCCPTLLPLVLLLGPLAFVGLAQQGPPGGASREAMWPAPTAEDWKRPCLITWQRTLEDALAVSRASEKAILVCVNMDGEIASEHYAGVRYRQPEIAALYEPYVCVIASVYRHTPRDHDTEGRRILCPRFGSVTCGEHIAIEPGLFGRYFEDQRVAPRHIGVELDGQEMYDVYYAWDTDTIFDALREGIASRPAPPPEAGRGDVPILERASSRDTRDRTAVEIAYLEGDAAERRALLEAAVAHADATPVDLLRLAVRGLDLELAGLARRALAGTSDPATIDLILDALRVPMEASEREALVAALERIGADSPRARALATVQRGLSRRSNALDVDGWTRALARSSPAPVPTRADLEPRLASGERALAAGSNDAAAQLAFAESALSMAVDPATSPKFAELLLQDARTSAQSAERSGADARRSNAVLSVVAYQSGDAAQAHARAESALSGLDSAAFGGLEAQGWITMAVLGIFAEARQQAIADALREKADWPGQWLADVHAAYSVLARHPLGTDAQVQAHYDLLRSLGAAGQAERVLDEGLARFSSSFVLHDRLRGRILEERGLAGLESTYESLLLEEQDWPDLEWFAGYASIVAAEFHRRTGADARALEAYERSIAHYERAVALRPDCRDTADHYVALAHAGRARVALEAGAVELALEEILSSFSHRPEAAATLDGLNLSPVDTAKMLLARLKELGRDDLVARLETALGQLDPALLLLPAYERDAPSGPSPDARTGRRRPL